MSYEGYVQLLCANGHIGGRDAYEDEFDEGYSTSCCECGAPWARRNSVDETSGCEGNPCICGRRSLVEITPAVFETCNLGHKHVIEKARYKFGPVGCHTPDLGEE